jgi:hypothetical protein
LGLSMGVGFSCLLPWTRKNKCMLWRKVPDYYMQKEVLL